MIQRDIKVLSPEKKECLLPTEPLFLDYNIQAHEFFEQVWFKSVNYFAGLM